MTGSVQRDILITCAARVPPLNSGTCTSVLPFGQSALRRKTRCHTRSWDTDSSPCTHGLYGRPIAQMPDSYYQVPVEVVTQTPPPPSIFYFVPKGSC